MIEPAHEVPTQTPVGEVLLWPLGLNRFPGSWTLLLKSDFVFTQPIILQRQRTTWQKGGHMGCHPSVRHGPVKVIPLSIPLAVAPPEGAGSMGSSFLR